MEKELHVEGDVVARRCSGTTPDMRQMTEIDWIVLYFVDGKRSFDAVAAEVPLTRNEVAESYIHLRLSGFLTWSTQTFLEGDRRQASGRREKRLVSSPGRRVREEVSLAPGIARESDAVCTRYLSERWFPAFHRFEPKLTDARLEMTVEMQHFTEFIYENLTHFSSYDLLGVSEGADEREVKAAFLRRSSMFHPDRYFRKDIGPFAPRLAAIFKAMTGAFTKLCHRGRKRP